MFIDQQVRQQIFLFLHQYGLIILPFVPGLFVASGTNPSYSRVIVGDGVGEKSPFLSYYVFKWVWTDGGAGMGGYGFTQQNFREWICPRR